MEVVFDSMQVVDGKVQIAAMVTSGQNSTRHLVSFPVGAVTAWDGDVQGLLSSHFPGAEVAALPAEHLTTIKKEHKRHVQEVQQADRRDPGGSVGGSPVADRGAGRRQGHGSRVAEDPERVPARRIRRVVARKPAHDWRSGRFGEQES